MREIIIYLGIGSTSEPAEIATEENARRFQGGFFFSRGKQGVKLNELQILRSVARRNGGVIPLEWDTVS
jgi:hypothetical protein